MITSHDLEDFGLGSKKNVLVDSLRESISEFFVERVAVASIDVHQLLRSFLHEFRVNCFGIFVELWSANGFSRF